MVLGVFLALNKVTAPNFNKSFSNTEATQVAEVDTTMAVETEAETETSKEAKEKAEAVEKPKPTIAERTPKVTATATGDCSLVYQYDWPANIAHQICLFESGGNPNASNWSDNHTSWAGCMGSFGLMQINCSHGRLYNASENMRVAYSMYKNWGNSFAAWTTCKKVAGCY